METVKFKQGSDGKIIGIEISAAPQPFVLSMFDEPGLYEVPVNTKTMDKRQALIVCAYLQEINYLLGKAPYPCDALSGGYWLSEELGPKTQFAMFANEGIVYPISKDGMLKVRRVL